jgi:hypothetical protein
VGYDIGIISIGTAKGDGADFCGICEGYKFTRRIVMQSARDVAICYLFCLGNLARYVPMKHHDI